MRPRQSSPTDSGPGLLAPELSARVRQIQIRTHRLVSTALAGGYRSTFRGQGVEFEEVRPYQPGDDVRSIDWNVTARIGEAHVKSYREERELTVHLLVDRGLTMDFGSRRFTKREAGAQIASLLAFVSMRHQDRVGLTLFGEEPGLHLPAEKGANHVLRIVREVIGAEPTRGPSDFLGLLEGHARAMHRRSLVFLISDFLDPAQEFGWTEALARMARRHDVIAVRIVDPFEVELPDAGLLPMRDAATGRTVEVDTRSKAVREEWRRAFQARSERLDQVFTEARVDSMVVRIDADLADPLVGFFRRREARRVVS